MSAPRRVWSALGTTKAVQVISVGMALYLIVIGFLTYGYSRVSDCVARYADLSAVSTTARADAAAQDRQADIEERLINDAERRRVIANDVALDNVLIASATRDRAKTQKAFAELLKVRAETARQRHVNDKRRAELADQRNRTEEDRRQHPLPAPPSQTC